MPSVNARANASEKEVLKDSWYGFENVRANDVLSREPRSIVPYGEVVPSWIAVNDAIA